MLRNPSIVAVCLKKISTSLLFFFISLVAGSHYKLQVLLCIVLL